MWMSFPEGRRGLASISKTVHGSPTNFEYTVLGTKGSTTWRFGCPDEVEYASGNHTTIVRRERANPSSGTSPFHGRGWLEGYIEITHQTLRRVAGLSSAPVPTLEEGRAVMEVLLNSSLETDR
jgi:predicted dehydrogenase